MSQRVRHLLLLTVLTLVAYGHVCANHFIDFDDIEYVTENQYVRAGLTNESIHWAFTTTHTNFWQPITWLSLELDATLFGPDGAWGFHLTNLLFHLANVLLLYRVMSFMTLRQGPSFWTAALFAVHPLHVESVAWVTERKDVLSVFLWLLSMGAYAWYALAPSWKRMLPVIIPFALGLMTKPMLVTFPFALLLLDFWPLRRWPPGVPATRFAPASMGRLIAEKIPLLLLAVAASVLVFVIKRELKEVVPLPLEARFVNAITSYGWYLWKTLFPLHLGAFYTHARENWSVLPLVLSALTLLAIMGAAIRNRRDHPYLFVGVFWFLGTLLPVIGFIQVGDQGRADRFVYLPHIGLFVALVWMSDSLIAGRQQLYARLNVLCGGLVLVLTLMTWLQVRHWKDAETLWLHTLKVTDGDPHAVLSLGRLYSNTDDPKQLEQGLRYLTDFLSKGKHPETSEAHFLAGVTLSRLRRFPEAIPHYEKALELRPRHVDARINLGHMLITQERFDEAAEQLTRVLEYSPEAWEAHYNLGLALMGRGDEDRAAEHFREASRDPKLACNSHMQRGRIQLKRGDPHAAETECRQALQLEPEHANAKYFLGVALGRQEKWAEALTPLRDVAPIDRLFRCAYGHALYQSGDREGAEEQYIKVTLLHPDWPSEFAAAAIRLATHTDPKMRDPRGAFEMAAQANQATGFRKPDLLDALAVTQAARGEFESAVKTADEALRIAEPGSKLAQQVAERRRYYEMKKPAPPTPRDRR